MLLCEPPWEGRLAGAPCGPWMFEGTWSVLLFSPLQSTPQVGK